MPTHAELRPVPYTPEQMFDLVRDVERYPEFLPWCVHCRITRRVTEDEFYADLIIGYKMLREKFVSKVVLEDNDKIRVDYLSGPLKYLSNRWHFIRNADGSCTIDFYVDFEFQNPLFRKLMGLFFNEAVRRMVQAFEARADHLYGTALSRSPS